MMNIFSFLVNFVSEDACKEHFKSERDRLGIVCKNCGHRHHYWIKSRESYECKKCGSRISLRSGTIMQNSNLSFLVWYKTIFLLTATKKSFSSKEIQKQLGLKRYEPVWTMVHKLRKAMDKRDDLYTLEEIIEMDEGYFTVESTELEKYMGVRAEEVVGKDVALMAESTLLEGVETGELSCRCPYFKAKVLEDNSSDQINKMSKESFDNKNICFSDKRSSYVNIADCVELHFSQKSTPELTKETLHWVHITIANAKRNLLDDHNKINGKYLQLYLNEFVYKLNKRYFGEKLFDRLVIASITGL